MPRRIGQLTLENDPQQKDMKWTPAQWVWPESASGVLPRASCLSLWGFDSQPNISLDLRTGERIAIWPPSHLSATRSLRMDKESLLRDWDEPQLWVARTGWGPGRPLHVSDRAATQPPCPGEVKTALATPLSILQILPGPAAQSVLFRVWPTGHSRLAHCLLLSCVGPENESKNFKSNIAVWHFGDIQVDVTHALIPLVEIQSSSKVIKLTWPAVAGQRLEEHVAGGLESLAECCVVNLLQRPAPFLQGLCRRHPSCCSE